MLTQSALQQQLAGRLTRSVLGGYHGLTGRDVALRDQRRSMLFFRAVPVLFAVVWLVLLVLAGVLLS